MVDERVLAANVDELAEADLRDDSAEFAARGRDTVCGRAIACRERLPRDDKRGRIGPEILEEVREAVEEHERLPAAVRRGELVVCEAHDTEEDGEHDKAHELDRFAAPPVDEEERRPIAGDEARDGEDHVADGDVLQVLVDLVAAHEVRRGRAEADRGEDSRRVKTETVERDVECEPRVRGTDEELEVLPLREVPDKVTAGSLGCLDALDDGVGVYVVATSGEEVFNVLGRLLDIALDVHGEPGGLGNGETEVESNRAWNAAETNEDTPHLVDLRVNQWVLVEDGVLVRGNDDETNKCGG